MFNFIAKASLPAGSGITTSATLFDDRGETIGSVMFFVSEELTLTYSEVLISFTGKLSCSSVHQHRDAIMRSLENDAIFDAFGGITTIRRGIAQ